MPQVKESLILVTGATGFIAMHIIQLLQREGYRVRGTVRSLGNKDKLQSLKNLCPNALYSLELVEADLTKDKGWNEAVRGCRFCIHVASPLPKKEPRREEDVIIPAVEGTRRVLIACARSGTIKRIVLTSSSCAVECENSEDGFYTEDDWTDVSSPRVVTYAKSKTMAEKAAWDILRVLPPERRMELVTVNPSYVFGPSISGVVCSSLEIIKRLMDRSTPLVPRLYVPFCDVRDVALAHLRALTEPKAAYQRHLIMSDHMWWIDIARILRKEFGPYGYFVPTSSIPNSCLYLLSFLDRSAKLLLPRLGKKYIFSNTRMKEVLKIYPRKANEILIDTVHSLIQGGALKKTKRYKRHFMAME